MDKKAADRIAKQIIEKFERDLEEFDRRLAQAKSDDEKLDIFLERFGLGSKTPQNQAVPKPSQAKSITFDNLGGYRGRRRASYKKYSRKFNLSSAYAGALFDVATKAILASSDYKKRTGRKYYPLDLYWTAAVVYINAKVPKRRASEYFYRLQRALERRGAAVVEAASLSTGRFHYRYWLIGTRRAIKTTSDLVWLRDATLAIAKRLFANEFSKNQHFVNMWTFGAVHVAHPNELAAAINNNKYMLENMSKHVKRLAQEGIVKHSIYRRGASALPKKLLSRLFAYLKANKLFAKVVFDPVKKVFSVAGNPISNILKLLAEAPQPLAT